MNRRGIAIVMVLGMLLAILFFLRQRREQTAAIKSDSITTVRHNRFKRVLPTAASPSSVPSLVGELGDFSPIVRERAASELGELGPIAFDALPDLKRLASDDPDEEVREAARTAVFNVRGGFQSPYQFMPGPAY